LNTATETSALPKVIVFDVFGTVVDWYSSMLKEVNHQLPGVDANDFTLAWRDGYAPALKTANESDEWVLLDVLHRRILDELLDDFNQHDVPESVRRELTLGWHRLAAWPDSVEGISRLKQQFTVCTLSNGNIGLLANMAKNAGLPWDCILSAEVFKKYKPDPATYLGVANVFDVNPAQVMLAAAHQDDLDAAYNCGLQTAYIERPNEFGPTRAKDVSGSSKNNWHAANIIQLATDLGC